MTHNSKHKAAEAQTNAWLVLHNNHVHEPWTPDPSTESECYYCYDCKETHVRFKNGTTETTKD